MTAVSFRPKKSLGQNFLVDENIARKMVRLVAPQPDDCFLEIGPGYGVLTRYFLSEAGRLVAVEIDPHLGKYLRETFAPCGNFTLIVADFLEIDLAKICEEGGKLRIVGNIPYHITSPVIFKMLEERRRVRDMTLMVQKEVAERIVAQPGSKDYGILSVYSQLFARPALLFSVSRNVFKPRPDVDSAVVRWDLDSRPEVHLEDEAVFRLLVRTAFQQRRKMLRRSLRNLLGAGADSQTLGFDLRRRPEALHPMEFAELSNRISGLWKSAI